MVECKIGRSKKQRAMDVVVENLSGISRNVSFSYQLILTFISLEQKDFK